MAVHSSILAWKIPWTEELGGLWPMGRNCYAQVAKSLSDHQGADIIRCKSKSIFITKLELGLPLIPTQQL